MTALRRRTILLAGVGLLALGLAAAAWATSTTAPAGSLTPLGGSGACLGPGHGCGRLRGPTGLLRLAISPDGRTLYASGQAGGLAVLARDPASGRVRQLAGTKGCVRRDGRQGCARVRGLIDPGAIAISPDGHSLYVTTSTGIEVFARTPGTGALAQIGCLDSARRRGLWATARPRGPARTARRRERHRVRDRDDHRRPGQPHRRARRARPRPPQRRAAPGRLGERVPG